MLRPTRSSPTASPETGSIADHGGGTPRLFTGIRTRSTLGVFLRPFTVAHVRKLDTVAAALLGRPAAATPIHG
jgi:hypothetical protein